MGLDSKYKNMVGRGTEPVLVEVEKGMIRRLATAVGEDHGIHHDEATAKAYGFPSLVATPTLPVSLHRLAPLYEQLGIDAENMMHAEEEYEYFRAICAGDRLNITHRIADIYEKVAPNGRLTFVVIETRGNDESDEPVFKGRRVLVELYQ